MPNMNSIDLKTKELLRYMYHCSFHGNLVDMVFKYAADAYCPKNLNTKYELCTI